MGAGIKKEEEFEEIVDNESVWKAEDLVYAIPTISKIRIEEKLEEKGLIIFANFHTL